MSNNESSILIVTTPLLSAPISIWFYLPFVLILWPMNTPLKALFLLLSFFSHICTHHFDSFASCPCQLRNKAFLLGPLTNSCLECDVIFETLTATVCAIVFIAVQHAKNTCQNTICNFQEQVNSIHDKHSEIHTRNVHKHAEITTRIAYEPRGMGIQVPCTFPTFLVSNSSMPCKSWAATRIHASTTASKNQPKCNQAEKYSNWEKTLVDS